MGNRDRQRQTAQHIGDTQGDLQRKRGEYT